MASPLGIDRNEVVRLYFDEQLSCLEVGRRLGCSQGTVKHHIVQSGRALRPLKKIDWPVEQMREWYEKDGMTLQEIADRLGQKQKVVNKVAKRHGFAMRKTGSCRERHASWRGGRVVDKSGYILIHCREHPAASKSGYVREHRLVMEQHLGRYLLPGEVVHHKNDIRDDNRIENLELFGSNRAHLAETLKGKCPKWTPEGLARIQAGNRKPKTSRRKSEHDAVA